MKRYYFGALLLCLAAPACAHQQAPRNMAESDSYGSGAERAGENNSVYSEAEIGSRARAQQQAQQSANQGMTRDGNATSEQMDMPVHREQRATASSSADVIDDTGRVPTGTATSSYGNPPGAYTGSGTTRAITPSQGTSSGQQGTGAQVVDEEAKVVNEAPIGRAASVAQGTSHADRQTTARIRRAIMDDDALSYTAKTVQVTTRDGNIALRGQVLSDKERWQVERISRGYAGSGKVDNYLSIKSPQVSTGSD